MSGHRPAAIKATRAGHPTRPIRSAWTPPESRTFGIPGLPPSVPPSTPSLTGRFIPALGHSDQIARRKSSATPLLMLGGLHGRLLYSSFILDFSFWFYWILELLTIVNFDWPMPHRSNVVNRHYSLKSYSVKHNFTPRTFPYSQGRFTKIRADPEGNNSKKDHSVLIKLKIPESKNPQCFM